MSCVVALAHEHRIYMECDSLFSIDRSIIGTHLGTEHKAFIRQACTYPLLIGCTGPRRLNGFLRHALSLPDYPGDALAYTWHLADQIREGVGAFGLRREQEGQEVLPSAGILIGIDGRLFHIGTQFSVIEQTRWAIGAGRSFALGALYATARLPTKERITLALEAASAHCPWVRPPFHVEVLG